MKKTYINPNIEVVKIASHAQMLAGSLTPGAGKGTVNETDAPSGVDGEARLFDFDDED